MVVHNNIAALEKTPNFWPFSVLQIARIKFTGVQIPTLLLMLGFHGFLTSVDRLVWKSGEMCNSMPPGFSRGYE